MKESDCSPIDVTVVAVPETAGSALYGMVDVLMAAGNIWQTLVRSEPLARPFRVRILSTTREPFVCGNGIPITPLLSVADDPAPRIVILPELWLGPDEPMKGRYPELMDWIRRQHGNGASIYSACSGAVMLAETGLLDECDATSHWGYQDLFRTHYPKGRFRPEPHLAFADPKNHDTCSLERFVTDLCRVATIPRQKTKGLFCAEKKPVSFCRIWT